MARFKETIALTGVNKDYRITSGVKTQALKHLNLRVTKGDFLAIMGRSGSGKSSLMHIIGLLDRHFEGTYLLDGKDASKLSSAKAAEIRNRKIGFVFQQFNLLKRTTVLQNVLLPTTYHAGNDDELRALKMLERVGLGAEIHKLSNQLSGGQIQRVAIARALIMNPALLLADEPTGNLDSKTSHEIMELFREINRAGTTVVLITHEEEIARYAKRMVKLQDGEVIEEKKL